MTAKEQRKAGPISIIGFLVLGIWLLGAFPSGLYYNFDEKRQCIEDEGWLKGWLWCSSETNFTFAGNMLRGFFWPLAIFSKTSSEQVVEEVFSATQVLRDKVAEMRSGGQVCKAGRYDKESELEGLTYHEARKVLLSAGWSPMRAKDPTQSEVGEGIASGNGAGFLTKGYSEIESCSGTRLAPCSFRFTHADRGELLVFTEGEEAPESDTYARVTGAVIECKAEGFCAYESTNQLAWDESFQASLKQFFGGARADFYYTNGSVYDQVSDGLGGPPDDLKQIGQGLVIASACRHQSCPEKAAVIIRCPNKIEAAAIIHFACRQGGCDESERATLFFGEVAKERVGEQALRRWARENGAEQIDLGTQGGQVSQQ